ncbi:MAG: hypothetical protein DCF12_02920 [Snowella sp.]|nr:MAG: hypothetical protein DCF12_02920 [Snowella sp.]
MSIYLAVITIYGKIISINEKTPLIYEEIFYKSVLSLYSKAIIAILGILLPINLFKGIFS